MNVLPSIRENVPLTPLTTWRMGGPARFLVEPTTIDEVVEAHDWAGRMGLPVFVMGKGSNLLVADDGYEGLIIRMGDRLGRAEVRGDVLWAEAGCPTHRFVKTGQERDLGGLEYLTTIPGSVGGTVFMNAGAHGHSVMDHLVSATLLLPDGSVTEVPAERLEYRYRHSNVRERGATVLAGTFRVHEKSRQDSQREVQELARWRRERQPQALSAGSVFTNPPEAPAGKLIEQAGCKGLTVGGAQVSPVHANFFVNLGGGTSRDMSELADRVQERVHEVHGIWLHAEVQTLGCALGQTRSRT